MQETLAEVEPRAARAQPTLAYVPGEKRKSRKKPWYLRMVPASLIRFHNAHKKKRGKAGVVIPIIQKPQEGYENLEGACGLGSIVIPSFQRFNNIHCFLIFYCTLVFSQGIVFGLVDLNIDTFWRSSRLKTIESVVLSLSYDISSCLVVGFISFYGGRGNIPKWITASSFLIGFGSLLFAFPFFRGKNYQFTVEIEDICKDMKTVQTCKRSILSQSNYVPFFVFGQTVQGIAGVCLYILGICFLDDSVSAHSTGTYLGIMDASVIIGYAVGYTIGAPLVKTSVNSTFNKSIGDSHKEHWLQTWWIRFVFVSVIAWSTLIPLSCFPRHLRGTERIRAGKKKKPRLLDRRYKDQEFGTSIKDLFASVRFLMKTPMFVCMALTRAAQSLVMIGAAEFLPLYLENQFVLTATTATILSGLVLIPGGALGQLLGGIIVSKLHMYCKGLMTFIIVTSAISLVPILFVIFVHCDPTPVAGINEDYGGTGQLGNLTAPCNSYCRCSPAFYSAICGRDDIGYFSPCFAGCTYSKTFNNHKTYFNCSCINEGLTTPDDQGDFIDARAGTCDSKCYKLPLFIVLTFSTIVFSGFSDVPSILTILRIVPDKQRSLALGISNVILKVFGSMPGPVVFKMVGESFCTFRVVEGCRKAGGCRIYNTTKMASLFVGICFFCKVLAIIFTAIAFSQYKYLLKENSANTPIPVKNLTVKKKEKGKN
nr:PREDICTED: solute carrier organic anion transporter family member 6A1 [Rhinolophus sinicus]